jgi:hypothetical protein
MERMGSDKVAITPLMAKHDQIQAGRWLLQRKIRFHQRCAKGVSALKQYHYEWNEDRKVFSAEPEHDWSSHAADGFSGLSVVSRATGKIVASNKPKPKIIQPVGPTQFTLDQLYSCLPTHEPSRRL